MLTPPHTHCKTLESKATQLRSQLTKPALMTMTELSMAHLEIYRRPLVAVITHPPDTKKNKLCSCRDSVGFLPGEDAHQVALWHPTAVFQMGDQRVLGFFCLFKFLFLYIFCIKKKSIIITTNYKGLEQDQNNEWITSAWEADTLNSIVMIQAHSSILHFFLSCWMWYPSTW